VYVGGCAPIVLESGGFGSSLLEVEVLLAVHKIGSDGGGWRRVMDSEFRRSVWIGETVGEEKHTTHSNDLYPPSRWTRPRTCTRIGQPNGHDRDS